MRGGDCLEQVSPMKILRRFLSVMLFFPAIVYLVVFGGFLAWAAIGVWIVKGEIPEWPEIACRPLDWLSEWGDK